MSDRKMYTQEQIDALVKAQTEKYAAGENLVTDIEKVGGFFGRVFKSITQFFEAQFRSVWTGFATIFKAVLDNFTDGSIKRLLDTTAQDWNDSFQHYVDLGWLDKNDLNALNDLYNVYAAGPGLRKFFLNFKIYSGIIDSITTVIGSTAMQRMNKSFSPAPPTPESVIRTSFIAPELHDRVVDAMQRSGLSKEDIELLFVSQYQMIDVGSLIQIYHREGKGDDWIENRLSELGFTGTRISEIKTIIPSIPPMQDILMMLAKEAFEPEMISKFGLGAEYPPQLSIEGAKRGFSEEWMQKYWSSHWIPPGLQTILEGYHRGFMKWEDVYEYMKFVEIPPYFRDLIRDISHNPLTRVDVRRIHDMGIIDDERLIKAYQDLGYDRENAEIMSEFTKEYNERAKRDLTKTDILKGYEDRDLDYNTAVFLLVRIGYKEDAAGYLISNVDLEMERAVRLDQIETAKLKYTQFLITEAQARTELSRADLPQKRINELLSRWKALKISNTKHPSKTDLDKLLRAEIISEGEYGSQMLFIGYSEKYIVWYKELIAKGMEA